MIDIVEELKIINLVLELIPIELTLNKMDIVKLVYPHPHKESKPEWQPKFKVGDWVMIPRGAVERVTKVSIEDQRYATSCPRGYEGACIWKEKELKLWQPMQELKDQLTTAKEKINKLKDDYGLLEKIRVSQGNMISKLFKTKQELQEQLVAKDKLLKQVEGNGYSSVIDRIARSEKTKLPKGVEAKHKWVELSEFVKNNSTWIKNNFAAILAQIELFYKKGDLINYSYDIKNHKFTFEYKPGITKLMMPLRGFEE